MARKSCFFDIFQKSCVTPPHPLTRCYCAIDTIFPDSSILIYYFSSSRKFGPPPLIPIIQQQHVTFSFSHVQDLTLIWYSSDLWHHPSCFHGYCLFRLSLSSSSFSKGYPRIRWISSNIMRDLQNLITLFYLFLFPSTSCLFHPLDVQRSGIRRLPSNVVKVKKHPMQKVVFCDGSVNIQIISDRFQLSLPLLSVIEDTTIMKFLTKFAALASLFLFRSHEGLPRRRRCGEERERVSVPP